MDGNMQEAASSFNKPNALLIRTHYINVELKLMIKRKKNSPGLEAALGNSKMQEAAVGVISGFIGHHILAVYNAASVSTTILYTQIS